MPGLALRPQHSNSASFVRLAESLSVGATDEMTFLQDASSAVNDILLQAGNATEHLTPEDQSLLESVKKIIKDDMYGSMRQAQEGDEADLAMLWNNIKECNVNIKARQSSSGDLGMIHNEARQLQIELDRLRGIVDEKTHDNDTYWNKFDLHMQMISDPPACPDFPNPRGMAQLDIYFKMSGYSTWWTSARGPYHSSRDLFLAADEALRQAIAAYNIHQAKLIVKFCDYKVELEAACESYDTCYASAVELYNEKVAGVKITVAKNLEIVKAAETLLAQVRFLLAQQKDRETPAYSTSEWEVTYKAVPEKTLCDESTLTAPIWKPPIKCESAPVKPSCHPASTSTADAGWIDAFRGWYDVQGCGKCNDYCRWVGNSGSGGDPKRGILVKGDSWWSCRLAGGNDRNDEVYTGRTYFSSWTLTKCSGWAADAP